MQHQRGDNGDTGRLDTAHCFPVGQDYELH